MADSSEDELLLADIAAYLDAHEPLQALWGVSGSGDSALLDALSNCADIDALPNADTPPPVSPVAYPIHNSESSSEEQHHHHLATKTIKGVRNVTRERQQREIKELRAQCAELEQRLAELQQQTKCEAPDGVSFAQQKLLLATWKRIAQRQLELRTLAEIENWRLKQQAEVHRMVSSSMQQSLHQWTAMEPASLVTPRPSSSYAPRPTHIAMQPCDTIDAVGVEIITNLVADLDAEYLRMDHVLRENGLIHWQVASKTSTMHMKTRCPSSNDASIQDREASSLYIEFMEADVIPFDVKMVFKVVWQCWQRRRIPESSGVYERIPHLKYDDPTTIITKMRFKVFVNGESVELDAYCVLKAYVEEQGRISTVLRAITKADDHFPGVYIDETDWQLMKPMQEARLPSGPCSTPSSVNATALFACAHMESRQFGGGGPSHLVDMNSSPLAKLTASTFEVDTDHVSDMMMNMLLQERSSSSRAVPSDAQETSTRVGSPHPHWHLCIKLRRPGTTTTTATDAKERHRGGEKQKRKIGEQRGDRELVVQPAGSATSDSRDHDAAVHTAVDLLD